MKITLNNITIRSLDISDLPNIYKWLTDDEVLKYYGGRDKKYTLEKLTEHYTKKTSYDLKRVIIEYNDKKIGYGQFYRLNDELLKEYSYKSKKIVYALDQFIGEKDYWNRGIGTNYLKMVINYLIKEKKADIILIDPHINNKRAIRAYEKAGFKIIKLLKKHELFEGIKVDSYLMEYICKNNLDNKKAVKYLLKDKFDFEVKNIKNIGMGYDSIAYFINDIYIFKINYSNTKSNYLNEKSICNFLNENIKSNIKIPKIEYYYLDNKVGIIGYKKINGNFLTPKIYEHMSLESQKYLKKDIAILLKELHQIDFSKLKINQKDDYQIILEQIKFIKDNYKGEYLKQIKLYINNFLGIIDNINLFDSPKCLCHNDFSANHLLIDDNNNLVGVIDFGDANINFKYADYIYLLEDSDEEIGQSFGMDILKINRDVDIKNAVRYQEIMEKFYPINLIYYGIINNDKKLENDGLKIILKSFKGEY